LSKKTVRQIVKAGAGLTGKCWDILGQKYFPKVCCDTCFAYEAISAPGDFFPVHIHATQDKFLIVLEGMLDLKLDGEWMTAHSGDLVHMPRGMAHGFFNRSERPVRALIWVSPAAQLEALFEKLDGLKDVEEIIRLSTLHNVEFLPPEANE